MEENKDIKRCPFCGEEIKVSAKKCRYCKNWITEDNKPTQENKEIIETPIVVNNEPLHEKTNSNRNNSLGCLLFISITLVFIILGTLQNMGIL